MNSSSSTPIESTPRPPAVGRVLRLRDVLKRVSCGRSTWLALVKTGDAPAPIKLSPRIHVWTLLSIDQWLSDKAAKS